MADAAGIVQFTENCLSEDEASARRAAISAGTTDGAPSPEWTACHGAVTASGGVVATGIEDIDEAIGDHIARHDPARVLAEIAAKRRLLDVAFDYAAALDGEWGDSHTAEQIRAGECDDHYGQVFMDVLRPLAAPYAGREGWLDEWAIA